MKKITWNHLNAPDYLDSFIQRMEYLAGIHLKDNPHYQKLAKREEEILKEYPIISRLVEGEISPHEETLSQKEQKAFVEFFSIELSRNTYEELEIYLIAQGDLFVYLNTIIG